jgi:hypothetical protein
MPTPTVQSSPAHQQQVNVLSAETSGVGVSVRRWTGAFGVAAFVLILVAQPLYFISGTPPRLEDTVKFSDFVTKNHTIILTRSLLDVLVVACFLIFLAGLRHLIRQARAEYEWAAILVFGAGMVWAILVLMGDVFEDASALDTFGTAEPTAVRALTEGSVAAFGAIGLIMAALFIAAAGYAIVATGGAAPLDRLGDWCRRPPQSGGSDCDLRGDRLHGLLHRRWLGLRARLAALVALAAQRQHRDACAAGGCGFDAKLGRSRQRRVLA